MADYKTLLGLKVFSIEEGTKCGKVIDLLVDYKKCVVFAIIVKGGWSADAEIVSIKDVDSIGENAVMIPKSSVIKPASKFPEAKKAIKEHIDISKIEVLTRKGHVIGKISTYGFDDNSGKVQQFVIAGSVLKSIFEGKNIIPVARVISIGKDAMIVHEKEEKKAEPKKTVRSASKKTGKRTKGDSKKTKKG